MKFKNISIIKLFVLLILVANVGIFFPVNAATAINYDTCSEKFKDPAYKEDYKDLYYAVNSNDNSAASSSQANPLYAADCPPSLQDIEFVVMRVITVLLTLVGLFVFISFASNSFIIISAGSNKDKIKKARSGIQMAIIGVLIIVMSYTLIIFIATQLGLSNDANQFSILDGGKLIFRFLFEY